MTRRPTALLQINPHAALAVGATGALAAEYARLHTHHNGGFLIAEVALALTSLLVAWRGQERLRFWPLLALAMLFNVSWIGMRLGTPVLEMEGGKDTLGYQVQGHALLHGDYPRSEYPVGAALLFAFEALLGRGSATTSNALLMIPFQCATVALVWATRSRLSPWLAALVAFWPTNAFWWGSRFDLVPTTLLAAGLVLSLRRHWWGAGVAFGVGTLVKWTPSLAFLVLVVWLLASREIRAATKLAIGFLGALVLVYVPFLAWSPHNVLAAYTIQGKRHITGESLWYVVLRALGEVPAVTGHVARPISAPTWWNPLATVIQVALLISVIAAAAIIRPRLQGVVAIAAVAPVIFFVTNRIFSPQFMVPILVSCAIATALVVRDEHEQLGVGLMLMAAATANLVVYPFLFGLPLLLELASSIVFGACLFVCAVLLQRSLVAT